MTTGPTQASLPGRTALLLRSVVALALLLALLGAGFAARELAAGAAAAPAPGDAVSTAFGSVRVARATTTFVPDTQGPPSAAQHAGTRGAGQLQVWLELVNDKAEEGILWSPDRVLLDLGDAGGTARHPDGSTVEQVRVPRGGALSSQVWFDLDPGQVPDERWTLQLDDGGPQPVAVPLATTAVDGHVSPGHDDGTPAHDEGTPAHEDGTPAHDDGTPAHDDGKTDTGHDD